MRIIENNQKKVLFILILVNLNEIEKNLPKLSKFYDKLYLKGNFSSDTEEEAKSSNIYII